MAASLSSSYTDGDLKQALACATRKLGLSSLKQQQEKALGSFIRGHDLFVSLPTGFGKSVIYQGAPLCMDFLQSMPTATATCSNKSIKMKALAIVIMPLKSLIEDQLNRASKLGLDAADLSGGLSDKLREELSVGRFSMVFTSPEFLCGEAGREFMKADYIQERVCGLFIDESHCVAKWGQSSTKTKAFRSSYGRLGEVRSLLPLVPVVAMTATATREVRSRVVEGLGMRNYVLLCESPDKPNIKHVVIESTSRSIDVNMKFLVNELRVKGLDCERTIVYCRSRKNVAGLYSMFLAEVPDTHRAMFNMYHTNTENDVQQAIIEDFRNPNGGIRVLFATIAYGMGVDVKGTYTTIMYGSPSDIDDYLQMAGRIGTDGRDSTCITLKYPGDSAGHAVTPSMARFLKGEECRRNVIMESFNIATTPLKTKHSCCDVCASSCACGGNRCVGELPHIENLIRTCSVKGASSLELPILVPTAAQLRSLERSLESYRDSLIHELPDHIYSGRDIASGLPDPTIAAIIKESNVHLSKAEFMNRYCFLSEEVGEHTWTIYMEALGRTGYLLSTDDQVELQDGSDDSDIWSGDEYAAVGYGSDSD